MDQKKLILSLIKDDLIHLKILYSFEKLGFYSDCYCLHLSSTVFELIGYKSSKKSDKMFNRYLKLSEKVLLIDITGSNKLLERLAMEIYEEIVPEGKGRK